MLIFLLFSGAIIVAFLFSRFANSSVSKINKQTLAKLDKAAEAEHTQEVHETASSLADLGYDTEVTTATLSPKSTQPVNVTPRDLFYIYLAAPAEKPFQGYELVEALLSVNLRHGARDLFHYYDQDGKTLFSVAQATETGAFELEKIHGISCRGLVFFMQPEPSTAEYVLEKLLSTAHQLATDLGGRLEDAYRQPLTQQAIEQYRRRCVSV